MKQVSPIVLCISIVLAYAAGQVVGGGSVLTGQTSRGGPPAGAAVNQQQGPAGALPPGEYSKIQLAPDQGEPTVFLGDDLRKAHTELQARAKSGAPAQSGYDSVAPRIVTSSRTTGVSARKTTNV